MGWLLKKKDKLKENINLKADDFSKIKRINSIDEIIEEKNIKPLNEVSNINHDYKLPSSELLKSNESRSLLPFIEKIINRKEIIIPLGLNKNEIIVESLNKMPNLLIGGTVMSGKTAFINTIISTILLTKKPWEVKLIIYDYKNVDYAQYNGIPHLLCPVITDKMKLAISLKKIYCEIEKRLELLNKSNSKNIDIYNSSYI